MECCSRDGRSRNGRSRNCRCTLSVAISSMVKLVVAVRSLNTADCHNPQYTFERRALQVSELQLPPFYIDDSSPCLLDHKFLMRNFLGVRQLGGGLFRPKLYTNGLSRHTISWYYPFKWRSLPFLFLAHLDLLIRIMIFWGRPIARNSALRQWIVRINYGSKIKGPWSVMLQNCL
jgi:hypothetical protein